LHKGTQVADIDLGVEVGRLDLAVSQQVGDLLQVRAVRMQA
jgi:hypothetical protein